MPRTFAERLAEFDRQRAEARAAREEPEAPEPRVPQLPAEFKMRTVGQGIVETSPGRFRICLYNGPHNPVSCSGLTSVGQAMAVRQAVRAALKAYWASNGKVNH